MARNSADTFASEIDLDSQCRGGSSLTLSLGILKLSCELGIRRAEDREPVVARTGARPAIGHRLLCLFRPGTPGNSRQPDNNHRGGSRRGRAGSRGRRYPRYRNVPGAVFWTGLSPAEHEAFRAVPLSRMAARDDSAAIPAQRPQPLSGENCTIILSDVTGFGARNRTDEDRRTIREALFNITHRMLRGIPDVWSWDDRGDGLLTVIPPSVPTARVISKLHRELPAALDAYNHAVRDSARIQLRVAINVGPVATDSMGVSGEAIIVTARLVEAPLFKKAMHASRTSLGLIASTFIYETVIRHDRGLTDYSNIEVDVKETNVAAWMKLFETVVPEPPACRISDPEAARFGSGRS